MKFTDPQEAFKAEVEDLGFCPLQDRAACHNSKLNEATISIFVVKATFSVSTEVSSNHVASTPVPTNALTTVNATITIQANFGATFFLLLKGIPLPF